MVEVIGACAAILLVLGLAWALAVPPWPSVKALAALAAAVALLAARPPGYEGGAGSAVFFAAKISTLIVPIAVLSWRPWRPNWEAWLVAAIGPLMMINIAEAVVVAASSGAWVNAAVGVALILLQPMASTGRLVHDRAGPFHIWCHYAFTRRWIVAYTLWNIGFVEVLYAERMGFGLPAVMIGASLLFPVFATWRRPERWLMLRMHTLAAAILMRLLSGVFEGAGLGALNGFVTGTDGMVVTLCNLAALPLLAVMAAANPQGSALAALRAWIGRRPLSATRRPLPPAS